VCVSLRGRNLSFGGSVLFFFAPFLFCQGLVMVAKFTLIVNLNGSDIDVALT